MDQILGARHLSRSHRTSELVVPLPWPHAEGGARSGHGIRAHPEGLREFPSPSQQSPPKVVWILVFNFTTGLVELLTIYVYIQIHIRFLKVEIKIQRVTTPGALQLRTSFIPSSTLSVSSNLYHLQDIALGMSTD